MLRTFFIAATAAFCATTAFSEDVTIATYADDATVPANPSSVAVFDMAALDMLDALNVR